MKNNCKKKITKKNKNTKQKQTTNKEKKHTKKNESQSKSSKVIYLVLSQYIFITYDKLVIHAHVCTI